MSRIKDLQHQVILDKKQTLSKAGSVHTKVLEDRTLFQVEAFKHDYKLSQAYSSVRNLEYHADKAVQLQTFKEFLAERGRLHKVELNAVEKPRPSFPEGESYRNQKTLLHYPKGSMLVLVDNSIYEAIRLNVDQYVLDVGRDGYWATVHVVDGGKPAQVRAYIKKHNPVGVLLVGAIAVPWFEMDDDFHDVHSEFPCDLYYMDTNGTWQDPDGDGKFQNHSGDLNPELWVGRLYTPTNNGNDANLINDYFNRNHLFRLGRLGHARSALAYVDDDWQGFDDCEMDTMFPPATITKYTNPDMTDADLYKSEVNSLRSWVQLCAHSWTQGHSLHVPSENTNEYIQTPYFRDINPPNAHFYNLFCCGPGRFTSNDYLAGWYIFDKTGAARNHGLSAVASSKSGSMLMFADFYRPLGQGKTIGDAFVEWWKARGPDHDLGERRWFYGLNLLGDPTLTWWKGCVPQPRQPEDGAVFDHWPRKMQFRWDPVNLSGSKYTVEVDAFHAVHSGQWAEQSGQTFRMYHNINQTTLDHEFVGMQPGRWRVRAVVDGTPCSWSPWNYFKFTI